MSQLPYRYFRRYMLLVELLIAMTLTVTILAIMMTFYDQVDRANSALEKEQNHSFRKLYLSTRLAAVVPTTISVSHPDKDYFFFTTNSNDTFAKPGTESLVFGYDNGTKLDPIFSNHVVGRLYVSRKNQLCLATWPSPERWAETSPPPMKNEILYDNVDNLSFEFYSPPAKDRQSILNNHKLNVKLSEQLILDVTGEWKKEWMQDYNELPPLVKIHVELITPNKEKEEILLAYPLPNSQFIILYDR